MALKSVSPSVLLSSGFHMPLIGFGTWKSQKGEVGKSVYEALRVGYRHIDAAWVYKNQNEVGEAIQKAISEGIIDRESLFVTSKLWNNFHGDDQTVEKHCRETLQQLGLSYLDLYLIHWPSRNNTQTWRSMERLVSLGLTRSIGVSNFSTSRVDEIINLPCAIRPAANQVEVHPMWRQDDLYANMKRRGIQIVAYSPLGSPDSSDMMKHEGKKLLEHAIITQIAQETGKTPGQILLRWGIQRGYSVLPKSVTPSRIQSNFDLLSWELSDSQMEKISNIEPQIRLISGKFFVAPNGPWSSVEELWGNEANGKL